MSDHEINGVVDAQAATARRIGGPEQVLGTTETAWASAGEVTAQTHVRYLDAPVQSSAS